MILVGRQFWERAVDADFLMDEGVIDAEDRTLFHFAETAEEIWRSILDWYECAGNPLCRIGQL